MTANDRSSLPPGDVDPQACTHHTRLQVLRRVPLFRDLDPERLQSVNEYWQARDYRAGEMIYRAGDPAETLFVVATGRVKLLDHTAAGQQIVLDLLTPGESFGSLVALGDEAYANDAEAQSFTCVLTLSATTFRELLVQYPHVALTALELTASRLRDAQTVVRELSALPVESRLAATLLKMGEKLGEPHPDGVLLQARLPQQDLAAMTGTTPESVSRTLTKLRQAGMLDSGRDWLLLKDVERLEEVAEGRRPAQPAPT